MQVAMKFDKRFFFDRQAVADIVGKKAAKILGKAGAYVQRRARSSMRRGTKRQREAGQRVPSSPGSPPRAWSTDKTASLKNIQFQFDPKSMSVLVGPMKLNGGGAFAVPGIHERGERQSIFQWRFNEQWFRTSKHNWRAVRRGSESNPWRTRSRAAVNRVASRLQHVETRQATVAYPPRPFMGPALKAESPKFPSLFTRSV